MCQNYNRIIILTKSRENLSFVIKIPNSPFFPCAPFYVICEHRRCDCYTANSLCRAAQKPTGRVNMLWVRGANVLCSPPFVSYLFAFPCRYAEASRGSAKQMAHQPLQTKVRLYHPSTDEPCPIINSKDHQVIKAALESRLWIGSLINASPPTHFISPPHLVIISSSWYRLPEITVVI